MTNIISFLPGPVQISQEVKEAFFDAPLSHRSELFQNKHDELKYLLTSLVNSKSVEIISGSGTVANQTIAMELTKLTEQGLILSNGEFGDRLVQLGNRTKLGFLTYTIKWGEAFDLLEIEKILSKNTNIKWIWFAHSETSTGVLNDIASIQKLCSTYKIKLCIDCMSSIGNIPIDLSGVFMASASSNKGLASFAGLAFVFYNHSLQYKETDIPDYLNLSYYHFKNGIPFTISTNLVSSLSASLKIITQGHFEEIQRKSIIINDLILNLGFRVVGKHTTRNPAVVTIELPTPNSAIEMGRFLLERNVYTSFESQHLKNNNWLQISLMGRHTDLELETIISVLIEFKKYKIKKSTVILYPILLQ